MPRVLATKAEFDQALKSAGGKLVVVDFTSAWCGPCRIMTPIFEKFSKTYADVAFFIVDIDANTEVLGSEGIHAVPTFGFYKNGKKVESFIGANDKVLEETIKRLM